MSTENWTEISSNSTKKLKQQHQKTAAPKRQSIKLQIELPFANESNSSYTNFHKNLKIHKCSKVCNTPGYLIENESDSDGFNDEQEADINPTIRLQISFDTVRSRSDKKNSVQAKPTTTASSIATSGYSSSSSSSSSMINYIHDVQEKSFGLNELASHRYVSEENIYDKLSFNSNTQSYKSMASLTNSSFNTSSSTISSAASITNPRYDPQILYEEISNFSQLKQISNTYENEMVKQNLQNHQQQAKQYIKNNKYKREYTVNEIFQNLKAFKQEAIQQEKLNTTYSSIQSSAVTVDKQKQPKSVSFLKQIFESKITKKSVVKSNECLDKQPQQPETYNSNHLYVNEKLIAREY